MKYIFSRLLPKTGQSQAYKTYDDGYFQNGWWKGHILSNNKVRFIDNGDGTITDRATKLMWQQITSNTVRTWENSITYAKNLVFAGYDDWRIPNIFELFSLLHFGIILPCAYTDFFTNMIASWYWTSTTSQDDYEYKFAIAFDIPLMMSLHRDSEYFCLCVRSL